MIPDAAYTLASMDLSGFPFGPLTWAVDKLLSLATSQPRLRLSVGAERSGPFAGGVTHDGRVDIVGPPENVVIRVVNVGYVLVEVESVGAELDDRAFVPVSGGDPPEVLKAPRHLQR